MSSWLTLAVLAALIYHQVDGLLPSEQVVGSPSVDFTSADSTFPVESRQSEFIIPNYLKILFNIYITRPSDLRSSSMTFNERS